MFVAAESVDLFAVVAGKFELERAVAVAYVLPDYLV